MLPILALNQTASSVDSRNTGGEGWLASSSFACELDRRAAERRAQMEGTADVAGARPQVNVR
jgi:hypothetical protein